MVCQIYPLELQLNKANTSDIGAAVLDLHLSISNDILSTKIYDKRDDFDFPFYMVMFPALHRLESISLNLFVLLEHLAMLLTSTLAINCWLRNFLNKAIGIINVTNPFLNFIFYNMIWYLNSKLDLNLSCVKDFHHLGSTVTWCINWRRFLAVIIIIINILK